MLKSQMAITGELLTFGFRHFSIRFDTPFGLRSDRVPSIDYPLFIAAGFNRLIVQAS
jgi:hypothetical protein